MNGLEPVLMMLFGAGNGFGGLFVSIHSCLWDQAHLPRAMGSIHDGSFVPIHRRPGFDVFLVGFQLGRTRDSFRAAVPAKSDGTAPGFGGELVSDEVSFGEGVALSLEIVVFHGGLNRGRRT